MTSNLRSCGFNPICLLGVLVLVSAGSIVQLKAGGFVAPYTGTLYLQCVGGSAGATSQVGLGSSPANFVSYLNGVPQACPLGEVNAGTIGGGQTVNFGILTQWLGKQYWAFSTAVDPGSSVSFTDECNTLGMNGSIYQQTSSDTWVMHLNDAAHYTISNCEANNILVRIRLAAITGVPQIGGTGCSWSGTYAYALQGDVASSGGSTRFADLGIVTINADGTVSGKSTDSTGGVIASRTLGGSYDATSSCEGILTLSDSSGNTASLAVSIANNSSQALFIQQSAGTAISGAATKLASSCNGSSLVGSYGYAISGDISGAQYLEPFASSGQLTFNVDGSISGSDVASAGGGIANRILSGTASVNLDCTGTAQLTDGSGATANLNLVFLPDTRRILFIQSDSATAISGSASPVLGSCGAATLNGRYSYSLSGFYGVSASSDSLNVLADAGELTADGAGAFSGLDSFSQSGVTGSRNLIGTYSFQSGCQGSLVYSDNLGGSGTLHFVMVEGGTTALFLESDSSTVVTGQATRVTASCQNAVLNGSYAYALSGYILGATFPTFADMGVLSADGSGNLTGHSAYSQNGTPATRTLQGNYSINPATCTGTASLSSSLGAASLAISLTDSGVTFVETDYGTAISGLTSGKNLPSPADAIVNAADYSSLHLVPGGFISVFGSGLANDSQGASALPLPTKLSGAQMTLNGEPMYLFYASPGQINAQVPWDASPGNAQFLLSVDGQQSAPVQIVLSPADPEVFTYQGLAIAVKTR